MATPQLGPGKAARFESHQRDDGRLRVTGAEADAFAFRTQMLRNVIHTGPWGHAGGHSDLAAFLAYHADPVTGIDGYAKDATLVTLPDASPDWTEMENDASRLAIKDAFKGEPRALTQDQIATLMAFLGALTDETSLDGRLGIPDAVPSGLPIDR
jgi:cytochrome c peroxidase